jgi:hypothetical protein
LRQAQQLEISVEAIVELATRAWRLSRRIACGDRRRVGNRAGGQCPRGAQPRRTAIERRQTSAQIEAIVAYARAWRLRYGERGTANWSLVASIRSGTQGIEEFTGTLVQARAVLNHLDDAIFFALPLQYFEVWQNVVLFDEPTDLPLGPQG